MHSPRRRGRIALATVVSLFGAVIAYACSDVSSPHQIDIDDGQAPLPVSSPSVNPSGLVAAYGFSEASGSAVADASGNGNGGSVDAGVTRTTAGKFGAALTFNGNGTVTIPGARSLALTTGMTLSAWLYPTSVAAAWTDVIMKGNDNYYLMAASASGPGPAAAVKFNGSQGTSRVFAPSNLVPNTWTYLAATYDGATLRLYVNGAEVARIDGQNNIRTSGAALRIGGDPYDGQFFRGTIDEVRVYNRALSVAELQTDMVTPVDGTAPVTPPVTPPEVATLNITGPSATGSYRTTSKTLSMSGASTGARVKRVTWSNSRGGSGTAVGTAAWSAAGIALQTGTNDLTVVARDSVDSPLANATLSVTVDEPPVATATQLAIQTQPSATVQTGVPLAQQPVIQLRDAGNNGTPVAGVTVAATIASGGGSLGGTTVVATNASGVATFTDLQITGTAGTRTLTFSANGLTSVTSTAIAVSAPGSSPAPPRSMYYNSSEPGCGTDPSIILCDDFESGSWYVKDCDDANASGGLLQTKGWCGTIYARPTTPPGAARCGAGVGAAGTNCAADGGRHDGSTGGRNMADHNFGPNKSGYNELWLRYYIKPLAGYVYGAQKMVNFNSTEAGSGGISLGGPGSPFNTGGFEMCTWWDCNNTGEIYYYRQNQGTPYMLKDHLGVWSYVEMHIKVNTPGQKNGVWELWVNDCGANGVCTGSPTLRARFTTVEWQGPTENKQIKSVWFENWANPGSVGTELYDQVMVKTNGMIGFVK